MPTFVSPDAIRTQFSAAMSGMYRAEVPLYGDLIEIVADANEASLKANPALEAALQAAGEIERLDDERHGAIRVGTPTELSLLRRVFAIMGMFPVGYYDLTVAGVPVHSTAFRPVELASLRACPFRMFTSLLRLDLIADAQLRSEAERALADREIVSVKAVALLEQAEKEGGLNEADAAAFVDAILDTFRWHGEARVSSDIFQRLNGAHRLIADIVSFKGPHINHLTPRSLDIDAVSAEMSRRGIDAKTVIEGPPRRSVAILLRQTSFKALVEHIRFPDQSGESEGSHTARFGEVEQRGVALTVEGRKLYDKCLDAARGGSSSQHSDYETRLASAFSTFPETLGELRERGLAFFRYEPTAKGVEAAARNETGGSDLGHWLASGWVVAQPITYEDFLPVSAAGIFQSNLGGGEQAVFDAHPSQERFEAALGARVKDPFALYAALEQASLKAVEQAFAHSTTHDAA